MTGDDKKSSKHGAVGAILPVLVAVYLLSFLPPMVLVFTSLMVTAGFASRSSNRWLKPLPPLLIAIAIGAFPHFVFQLSLADLGAGQVNRLEGVAMDYEAFAVQVHDTLQQIDPPFWAWVLIFAVVAFVAYRFRKAGLVSEVLRFKGRLGLALLGLTVASSITLFTQVPTADWSTDVAARIREEEWERDAPRFRNYARAYLLEVMRTDRRWATAFRGSLAAIETETAAEAKAWRESPSTVSRAAARHADAWGPIAARRMGQSYAPTRADLNAAMSRGLVRQERNAPATLHRLRLLAETNHVRRRELRVSMTDIIDWEVHRAIVDLVGSELGQVKNAPVVEAFVQAYETAAVDRIAEATWRLVPDDRTGQPSNPGREHTGIPGVVRQAFVRSGLRGRIVGAYAGLQLQSEMSEIARREVRAAANETTDRMAEARERAADERAGKWAGVRRVMRGMGEVGRFVRE